jgi:hypothetical protein
MLQCRCKGGTNVLLHVQRDLIFLNPVSEVETCASVESLPWQRPKPGGDQHRGGRDGFCRLRDSADRVERRRFVTCVDQLAGSRSRQRDLSAN